MQISDAYANMIYGYARVSTAAQDERGQVKQLKTAGCEKIFREKITGTTADRPQLGKLVKKLAPGDVVITPAGALRPYIERFDTEWLTQQPATGVTWDALEVATSLTGHPGKKSSLRHVFPKLQQILGRLETLDPNEEIAATARHALSATDETRSGRAFEREVASIFRALGAEVEQDVALLGMQIDLVTRERTPSGGVITSAIECKYYSRPAGIEIVNQFASAALLLRSQGKIDRAIIVALSGFTRPAREAAPSHNIELLELDDLKQRLTKVKPAELEQAREEVEAQEVTDKKRQQPRIFVVMPFAAEFHDVYILGIREVAEKLGFVIERADDIEHNNSIVQIILVS